MSKYICGGQNYDWPACYKRVYFKLKISMFWFEEPGCCCMMLSKRHSWLSIYIPLYLLHTGITCAAPEAPQNGNLSPALSVYTYQQQVSYTCANGYQLSGDTSISCIAQNAWSGGVPTCQGMRVGKGEELKKGLQNVQMNHYPKSSSCIS